MLLALALCNNPCYPLHDSPDVVNESELFLHLILKCLEGLRRGGSFIRTVSGILYYSISSGQLTLTS